MSTRIEIKSSGGSGSTPVGATLMKTGQTISYATGDDGGLQAGRAVDFFTLENPGPFGTKRFTDELGGQTYANDIVIDWSTYDNIVGTVLGYTRNYVTNSENWFVSIIACLSYSVGAFLSGWRMPNYKEMLNIYNQELTVLFSYSPFNLATNVYYWVSNSINATNKVRIYGGTGGGTWIGTNYSNGLTEGSMRCIAVRTFTVSGTTLS